MQLRDEYTQANKPLGSARLGTVECSKAQTAFERCENCCVGRSLTSRPLHRLPNLNCISQDISIRRIAISVNSPYCLLLELPTRHICMALIASIGTISIRISSSRLSLIQTIKINFKHGKDD